MQKTSQPDSEGICQRIMATAAQRGLTNRDLARQSKVSYRLIHEIMHGRANLRPRTIASIAPALGVEYEWLISGKGDAVPRRTVIMEGPGEYKAEPRADLPPLHLVIKNLADHIGCAEDEVLRWVLEKMAKRKPGDRS